MRMRPILERRNSSPWDLSHLDSSCPSVGGERDREWSEGNVVRVREMLKWKEDNKSNLRKREGGASMVDYCVGEEQKQWRNTALFLLHWFRLLPIIDCCACAPQGTKYFVTSRPQLLRANCWPAPYAPTGAIIMRHLSATVSAQ